MTHKKFSVFGVPVFSGEYKFVLNWALEKPAQFRRMVTINPLILEEAKKDSKALDWVASANLVVPDGEGICMALKRFHGVSQEPIKGIQLVQDILAKGACKVYFLGASEVRLKKAIENVSRLYPGSRVVGYQHGYFKKDDMGSVVKAVVETEPDYIFVGMGYPRQEEIIFELSKVLNSGLAIGVGGVIDVLSGDVAWAPSFVRRVRLEWLYRMVREPRRFRQLPLIFRFLLRTFFGKNV